MMVVSGSLVGSEPELPLEDSKILTEKTRIAILKILNTRRHTISELSRKLNLSRPTILHHLRVLENAGYVIRVEEGRKWIYYEISDSGKSFLKWRKIKIIIPVIVSTAMIFAIQAYLMRKEKPEHPPLGADFTVIIMQSAVVLLVILTLSYIYYIIKKV